MGTGTTDIYTYVHTRSLHDALPIFGPARVRGVDEAAEIVLGAEMRVHRREIGDPIAVIRGRFLPLRPLHGLVLEDRPDPHRRRAGPGDIGQFVGDRKSVV